MRVLYPSFFSNTNQKWPVIVAFYIPWQCLNGKHLMRFQSKTFVSSGLGCWALLMNQYYPGEASEFSFSAFHSLSSRGRKRSSSQWHNNVFRTREREMNMDSIGVMNLGHFLLSFSLTGFEAVIRSSGNASPPLIHILWGESVAWQP